MIHAARFLNPCLQRVWEAMADIRFKLSDKIPSRPDPKDLKAVMTDLDAWVCRHGKDGYVAEDFVPTDNHGLDHGVQQVRSEIHGFVKLLFLKELHGVILEIGLGNYGGTHMLWRNVFDRVITIEKSEELVKRFLLNEPLDSRSLIIIGASQDPRTVRRVRRLLKSIDVLFIDGDHEYGAVFRDWLAYHSLVRPGGLIAFHDSNCREPHVEVATFLEKLARGEVDGRSHKLHHIISSRAVGISYEEC